MRIIILILFSVIQSNFPHAQFREIVGNDVTDSSYLLGVKVGEKMPDIPLGTVVNNYTGKEKFSDFKGKLVILDFWNVDCSSCFAAFPKMEELQKKFGDKIQIILVNPWETQEEIIEKSKDRSYTKKYKMPNLPSIVNAKNISTLFPVDRGVPHHVWIDPNGYVRVRGSSLNTNEEKIKELLAGEKITYLKDNNITPFFDRAKPYFTFLSGNSSIPIQIGSFFTLHNNEYSPAHSNLAERMIDSAAGTVRSTYINNNVMELYKNVFSNVIEKQRQQLVYSSNVNSGIPWMDYILLYVKDTLRYTSSFIPSLQNTDKDYIKSLYCYEQIMPLHLSDQERRQLMLDDLNRYFGGRYGSVGSLEKRKVPCYVLVRTSKEDKLSSKSSEVNFKFFTEKGKKKILSQKVNLRMAVRSAVPSSLFSSKSHGPKFFLDATNITGPIDITLPADSEIKTIEDLRKALKPYDLDIVQEEREIEFVVIKEQ